MEDRELSLKSNMIWNSVGSFIYLLSQSVLSIIVFHILGENVSGNFILAMSLSNTFGVVASYGMRNFQVSDIEGKYTEGTYVASRYLTSAVGFISLSVFVLCQGYTLRVTIVLIVYMVFKLSETFVDVYQAINQKKMRMDIIGKSLIARSITTFFAFSLCLYFTKDIILSIIAMAIAAFVIIFFYDRQASRRLVEINYSKVKEQMLGLLVECFPLVSYLFISNSIMSIPRYYLEKYQGEAVLGFYGNIALPTLIIQVGAAYIFCPLISVFAQLYKEKDKKGFVLLLGKVFLGIGVISVVSIIGCIFLGDFGLVLLYKAKILPYSYLLIPVVIVTILNAIVWFLCALLTVIRDFKGLIISNLVALVITFVLSIIWIKSYSASGVNYTLYVALVVEIILLIIFGFQKFNKHEK